MDFSIELVQPETILQEPVRVRLTLTNPGLPQEVPLDYESTDVVTLKLLDAQGGDLLQGNAYTRTTRRGFQAERKRPDDMKTAPLDTGQTMQWDEDLLTFMEIPGPGDYQVQAVFSFLPQGLHMESEAVPLKVLPNRSVWMLAHRDQVAMTMAYFIQQQQQDEDSRTLYHIVTARKPRAPWKSGVLPVPAGCWPRLSEADFVTQKTFEHDFARWIVWQEEGEIVLTPVMASEPSGTLHRLPLGDGTGWIVGRPVQHADQAVSVLVWEAGDEKQGHRVRLVEANAKGKEKRRRVVASTGELPRPISSAADYQERIYLLVGAAGKLPLTLFTFPRSGKPVAMVDMLEPRHFVEYSEGLVPLDGFQLLAAKAEVKAWAMSGRAVLAAVLLTGKGVHTLSLVKLSLSDPPRPVERIHRLDFDLSEGVLQADETVATADLTPSMGGMLIGLITTSTGRLLACKPGSTPEEVGRIHPDRIGLATLMTTPKTEVYAFFPTEQQGTGHVLLQKPLFP